MAASDEQLVQAAQSGDSAAFGQLVDRWDRKIRGAIYRVLGSDDEARDLTQEAFFKAYRGLPSFKQEARFSSWLYQIALNLCRDRMRRKRGRVHMSLEELELAGSTRLIESGPSVQEMAEAGELSRVVAAAVAALPAEQREVIVLKEYQELTFAEIAEVLALPVSTVKTRLYRGLGQLRQSLERRGIHGPTALPRASGES
jgi:RNA polymerase sigma-70 factor (ECF subfamily)